MLSGSGARVWITIKSVVSPWGPLDPLPFKEEDTKRAYNNTSLDLHNHLDNGAKKEEEKGQQ